MKKKVLLILFLLLGIFTMTGCQEKEYTKDDILMEIKDGTLTNVGATIIITDTSGNKNTYGEWYKLEKNENGKWKDLEDKNYWYTLVGYTVDDDYKLEFEHNWESRYGKLEAGNYRLVKKVAQEYISVQFTIK